MTFTKLPFLAVSREDMAWNKTGTWRYVRPGFQNKIPPCFQRCPAGENIEGWIKLLQKGDYQQAYQLIREENPFPGICGRVCFRPCEESCNRENFDRAVSINALERFVADQVMGSGLPASHFAVEQKSWHKKRVAIIGSGPAGLTAAYNLAKMGYAAEIFEIWHKAGGVLRYGIPAYRLPKEVLDWEIEAILASGIKLHTGKGLGRDFGLDEVQSKFDAIFIATGFTQGKKLGIPGENNAKVLSGIDFLRRISLGKKINLGERVAIIGGGNTAIDSARTLRRAGVHAIIVYRRSRSEMPAFIEEIEEAEREGVEFYFLATPRRIVYHQKKLSGLECQEMQLSEVDASGRRGFIAREGTGFFLPVNGVVVAAGEVSEMDYMQIIGEAERSPGSWEKSLAESDSLISALTPSPLPLPQRGRGVGEGDQKGNSYPIQGNEAGHDEILSPDRGIFRGGDLVGPDFNVTQAIASGKKAAIMIDLYLKGERDFTVIERFRIGGQGGISIQRYMKPDDFYAQELSSPVVKFEDLNLDYFEMAERKRRPKLPLNLRMHSFLEVTHGLSTRAALEEAGRCFHCGVCNQCDNCLVYCPDISIIPDSNDGRYAIDLDHCKGCGICVKECPRAAIVIQEERPR